MMTLLSRSLIEPPKHKDTKTLRPLPDTLVPSCLRGKLRFDKRRIAGHSGQSEPVCIDHELGLLDLADALLRNAPQAYLQQAYAGTVAHINRCPACRDTLVDLVLSTLHYEAHLPAPTVPNPTEEGLHHDT